MITLDRPKKTAAQKKLEAEALAALDIGDLYIAARAAHREGRQDTVQEFLTRMEKYCNKPLRRAQRRSGKPVSEICSDVCALLMGLLDAEEPLAADAWACSIGTRIFTSVQNFLAQDQEMEARHHSIHVYGDEAVETALAGETNAKKCLDEMSRSRITAHLEWLGRDYLDWYIERLCGRSPEAIVAKGGTTASNAAIYEQEMVRSIALFHAQQQAHGTQPRKVRSNDH